MADALSRTFSALADPTRRAILARLALGETSVNELAAPFAISLPAISKHLKVLEHAGLISRTREAQWRPCKLEPDSLQTVDEWLDAYRALWEQSFDRLGAYLQTLQRTPRKSAVKRRAGARDECMCERGESSPKFARNFDIGAKARIIWRHATALDNKEKLYTRQRADAGSTA